MSDDTGNKIDFTFFISNVLRYGVTISAIVIAIGIVLILVGDHPANFPSSIEQLISKNYGRPTVNLFALGAGLASLNPIYIVQLGLLILLATPIVRVGLSVALFVAEKDMIYIGLTIFVLVVLLVAIFIVGPFEAAS